MLPSSGVCFHVFMQAFMHVHPAYFGNLVSASCCHKQPLCSPQKSFTPGQINYQVICHYLLSRGHRRSQLTGHASLCLYVWSKMETEDHSRTFGCSSEKCLTWAKWKIFSPGWSCNWPLSQMTNSSPSKQAWRFNFYVLGWLFLKCQSY